jgi:transcriptional antiterminator RfaH
MRSTKGVTRLDSFGNEPAQVDDRLIELLRAQGSTAQTIPEKLFKPSEHIRLRAAPFTGTKGICQMING